MTEEDQMIEDNIVKLFGCSISEYRIEAHRPGRDN